MDDWIFGAEMTNLMREMALAHHGVSIMDGAPGRGSGRYPRGSGENPYQHNAAFLRSVEEMRKSGMSKTEIAKVLGYRTTTELTNKIAAATNAIRRENINAVYKYKEEHPDAGPTEIGRALGLPEGTVRTYFKTDPVTKTDKVMDILRKNVDEKKYVMIGTGVELQFEDEDGLNMGVSRTRLDKAVAELVDQEGYTVHVIKTEQMGTGKDTTVMVLAPPGTPWSEIVQNKEKIRQIKDEYDPERSNFDGQTSMKYPTSISADRIEIRYPKDGGADRDGTIEIRRGVDDLSLGGANYAQVRIAVDDKYYLKGMAIYSDGSDMPPGKDIIFNTSKPDGTPPDKVFKKFVEEEKRFDKNNPFGAAIDKEGQREYYDREAGYFKQSPVNICRKEGQWDDWTDTLASQFLSKQSPKLAKQQLDIALKEKREEFDEIMSLNNTAVQQRLLESFADDCDGASVHLKAAALPRQSWKVILPIPSLKENEIYAPGYEEGEKVVLVRYPHAGKFEIPELTVTHNNPEAKKFIFNSEDAVGINPKAAAQLSGADFDGDTVLVIPNNNREIQSRPYLEGLKGFVTDEYKFTKDQSKKAALDILNGKVKTDNEKANAMKAKVEKGYKPSDEELEDLGLDILTIKPRTKQIEMGKVSNLITDMTLRGAPPEDIEKAVKHSMVVIDSEKHHLDWKQSELDNDIRQLKKDYQDGGGASTLISQASASIKVDKRVWDYKPDPETGAKVIKGTLKDLDPKKAGYFNKDGKWIEKKEESTKMDEAFYSGKDAFALSSGTTMETIYANFANAMRAMGNEARKASMALPSIKRDPAAAKIYAKEVASLTAKMNGSMKNAPYERQAQMVAGYLVKQAKVDNPNLTKEQVKKIKGTALNRARIRCGAKKKKIEITDKEWEAIQAKAIGGSKLKTILMNTDLDKVKERATPRAKSIVPTQLKSQARQLNNHGYSLIEIAQKLGLSVSKVSEILSEQ